MALNASETGPTQQSLFANPFIVIFLLGTLAMMPALSGAMRRGIDSIFHARWMGHFSSQFWGGEFYPRWLVDMNDGFGSPAFFIYPPFSQYVTALLHPLLPDPRAAALLLGISAWLAMIASGLACLLWLRRAVPEHQAAALIGALVYMLAPYHLYIDVYQRGALAEVWAFVWPPASLLLVHRLDRFRPAQLGLLALSVAGLLVTHAPSSLILVPAYFVYAGLLDWRDRRLARTLWLTMACGLGSLLAGWYLATALTQTQYINTAALFSGRNASGNWLIGGGAWPDPAVQRDIHVAVALQGMIGFGAATFVLVKSRRGDIALALAALLLAIVPLFMMSILSKPIWDLGLPLNRVQFPWRFNVLLSLASALAVALLAARLVSTTRLVATIPVILLIANALLYVFPAAYPPAIAATPTANPVNDSWDAPEYRIARKSEIDGAFAPGERVKLTNGAGIARVTGWHPRSIEIEADVEAASMVAVRQFKYPGWTVSTSPPNGDVALRDGKPYLLIGVPPGHHVIQLVLEETTSELTGRIASGIAAFIVIGLLTLGLLTRRRSA